MHAYSGHQSKESAKNGNIFRQNHFRISIKSQSSYRVIQLKASKSHTKKAFQNMKERPPLFSWDLFCTFMNVLKAEMAVEMGQNRHLFCFLYFRNCSVCVYLSTLQYGTTQSINNVLSASKLKIKFHLRFWCHLQLAVDNTRIKPSSNYVRMY